MANLAREPDGFKPGPTYLRERGELVWYYVELVVAIVELIQFGPASKPLIDARGVTRITTNGILRLLRRRPRWHDLKRTQVDRALRKMRKDGIYVAVTPYRGVVRTPHGWRSVGVKKLVPVGDGEAVVEVYEHRLTIRREGHFYRMPVAVVEKMVASRHGGPRKGAGRPAAKCDNCGMQIRGMRKNRQGERFCFRCGRWREKLRARNLRPVTTARKSKRCPREASSVAEIVPSERTSYVPAERRASRARGLPEEKKREQESIATSTCAQGDSPASGVSKNSAARASPPGRFRAIAVGDVVHVASSRRGVFRVAMPGIDLDRIVVLAAHDTPTGPKLRVQYSDGTAGDIYANEVAPGRRRGPKAPEAKETEQAVRMLRHLLAHGHERPLDAIRTEAADWELSWWALKKAKKLLGVRTHRERRVTYWRITR